MPYLDVAGTRTYHEVAGSGAPVLLLHGGFCTIEDFRPQIAALSAQFTILAPERPGHGRTADRDGPITFEGIIADVVAYLDAVNVGPVHVLGFSDGAIAGLLLARDQPHRVRSLISISANLDPAGLVDEEPDDDGESVNRLRYEWLSPDGAEHADVILDKLRLMWAREPHIEPRSLHSIAAPTLVMAGDRDSIRLAHTVSIASAIPGAQLCIVPGATHGLLAERPRLVTVIAQEFLAAQQPTGSDH